MSIKDLFNNPGTPKIQKRVTSNQLVATVESSNYVEAKRKEFEQFEANKVVYEKSPISSMDQFSANKMT